MLNFELPRESVPALSGYYQIIRIFSIFDSKSWQYPPGAFKILERSKASLGIIDYSLSQSSLEQVFLKQIRPKTNEEDFVEKFLQPNYTDYLISLLCIFASFLFPGCHQFKLGNFWMGIEYFFTYNHVIIGSVLVKRFLCYNSNTGCTSTRVSPNRTFSIFLLWWRSLYKNMVTWLTVDSRAAAPQVHFIMIYICNFHVMSNLLLIHICKLHWNLNTIFVCQVHFILICICNFHVLNRFLLIYICKLHWNPASSSGSPNELSILCWGSCLGKQKQWPFARKKKKEKKKKKKEKKTHFSFAFLCDF